MTYLWNHFLSACVMLVFCVTSYHQAIAGQVQMLVSPHSADLKLSLNRILALNIENGEEVARSTMTLESLERTLNALQPTLIMGLFRLTDETPLSTSQTALFLEMKQKMLAKNSRCKFSVTLHVSHYLTAVELLTKLQEVTTKLGPDIINMVVSSNNDVVSPTALARGIEYAHHHGELVIYEGPANMIPDGVDGFVMKAINGEVRRDEINNFKTRHHLPLIVQLPAATWSKDQKEIVFLTHLAEAQASFGYHLAYPLQIESSRKLHENKDASSLVMLRALMTRYN